MRTIWSSSEGPARVGSWACGPRRRCPCRSRVARPSRPRRSPASIVSSTSMWKSSRCADACTATSSPRTSWAGSDACTRPNVRLTRQVRTHSWRAAGWSFRETQRHRDAPPCRRGIPARPWDEPTLPCEDAVRCGLPATHVRCPRRCICGAARAQRERRPCLRWRGARCVCGNGVRIARSLRAGMGAWRTPQSAARSRCAQRCRSKQPQRQLRRAQQDSNLRPLAPEASALSTELCALARDSRVLRRFRDTRARVASENVEFVRQGLEPSTAGSGTRSSTWFDPRDRVVRSARLSRGGRCITRPAAGGGAGSPELEEMLEGFSVAAGGVLRRRRRRGLLRAHRRPRAHQRDRRLAPGGVGADRRATG